MKTNVNRFTAGRSAGKALARRQPARFVLLFVLTIAAVASLVTAGHATGNVNKGDLAGAWVVSLTGNTGCGLGTIQANFVLSGTGTGTATVTTHAQCSDSVLTGQTFTVLTISPNGSGTANLSCGTGCGWDFNIQVAPDRSTFSLVDVSATNPGNYLAGVAVHQ